jgi:hypothetical protein
MPADNTPPVLQFPQFALPLPDEITKAADRLAAAQKAVETARAGFHALGGKIRSANDRAKEGRVTLTEAQGRSGAAAAMGIAVAQSAPAPSLAEIRKTIQDAEDEAAALEAAKQAAPALFEPLLTELKTATSTLHWAYKRFHGEIARHADAAAEAARKIVKTADILKGLTDIHLPVGTQVNCDLPIDQATVKTLASCRSALSAAARETEPLVPPAAPKPINIKDAEEESDRVYRLTQARNLRVEEEGRAWREKIARAQGAVENAEASRSSRLGEWREQLRTLEAGYAAWREELRKDPWGHLRQTA